MPNELWMFIVAVFHYWQSLLTGGAIAIVIMIYERKNNKPLRWDVIAGVMVAALFISCFFAWKDQHGAADSESREISRLAGMQQADATQIGNLQTLLASKDRPVVLQATADPEMTAILKRQDEELTKLKASLPSPKKKALQLSHDILSFVAERSRMRPPAPTVNYGANREEFKRQWDQYAQTLTAQANETAAQYQIRFGSQVSSVLNDLKAANINTAAIDGCITSSGGDFWMQICGSRIGALADKLPE